MNPTRSGFALNCQKWPPLDSVSQPVSTSSQDEAASKIALVFAALSRLLDIICQVDPPVLGEAGSFRYSS